MRSIVELGGEQVVIQERLNPWIGVSQPHLASGLSQVDGGDHPNPYRLSIPVGVDLVFGSARDRVYEHVVSERRAGGSVPQNELDAWADLVVLVAGNGTPYELDLRMVAQVLAHSRRVADHRDTELGKMPGRPNAGQHQQVWRTDSAGGQDDLVSQDSAHLSIYLRLHADRPVAVEHNAVCECVGHNRQIRPVARRIQVAQSGAPAYAVWVVEWAGADSGRVGVVMVRAVREAILPARLIPGGLVRQHVFGAVSSNYDRPIYAVEVVGEVGVRLYPAEVRQQFLETPLLVAPLAELSRPVVVVLGHASEEDLGVNG